MAIIVIGGHSRNVGKTSVVAGIISALSEYHWSAFKITQYGNGVCSRDGEACHCATDDHSWAINQENDCSGSTDTSRFLRAGAASVFWVRSQQGKLAEAIPALRRRLEESQNSIMESNSVMKFVRPDLYLPVLDPAIEDFKSSAQQYLDRADAVILHQHLGSFAWQRTSLKPVSAKPIFRINPPIYVTDEIIEFVRTRLKSATARSTVPTTPS
jgi:hypothetical protein